MSKSSKYTIGDTIWIPDGSLVWIPVIVDAIHNHGIDVIVNHSKFMQIKSSSSNLQYELCGNHLNKNIENLIDLDDISQGAILYHIRKRFQQNFIFTLIGPLLLIVNPYQSMNMNDISYSNSSPHIYSFAMNVSSQLQMNICNQSIILLGESGAGKTESCKQLLYYYANVLGNSQIDKSLIIDCSLVLDAFGNAKTSSNDNSSRFSKWMKLQLNQTQCLQGIEIMTILPEKWRVVKQLKGERNFHIFYQLLSTTDRDLRSKLSLGKISDYFYLNQSDCNTINKINDLDEFHELMDRLNKLQLPSNSINDMLELLSAILTLGNIVFIDSQVDTTSGEINATFAPNSIRTVETCAKLLKVESSMLIHALTMKLQRIGKDDVLVKISVSEATRARDNLAMTLYKLLFDWIISIINQSLQVPQEESLILSIGILDIYGFEVLALNSFEQFCVSLFELILVYLIKYS